MKEAVRGEGKDASGFLFSKHTQAHNMPRRQVGVEEEVGRSRSRR